MIQNRRFFNNVMRKITIMFIVAALVFLVLSASTATFYRMGEALIMFGLALFCVAISIACAKVVLNE